MSIQFQLAILLLPVIFAIQACTKPAIPVELSFAVQYGDSSISCTDSAVGIQLTDLRFFVHDIELMDESGADLEFQMAEDDRWQDGIVALIDLENGQGACLNGSVEMNGSIQGTVRANGVHKITFSLGIPEALNHLDPVTVQPPRNFTAMHWHWLNGYKFLRTGAISGVDGYSLHLGSSHCDGVPGSFNCRTANRPRVVISDFDPARQEIILDIKNLFEGIDFKDGRAGDCSSGPDQSDCGAPFRTLGIEPQKPSDVAPGVFRAVAHE
jgi:uncharacterized repeat protein (TIGR04052 family)